MDIFSPSFEEIFFMLHRDLYEDILDKNTDLMANITSSWLSEISNELLKMGAKIIMLKLGDRGAYLRTSGMESLKQLGRAAPSSLEDWANQEIWSPCYNVEVVGTTGSGDATIAGFLSGILRNLPPQDALNAAVAVGACNVEASDALSGLLTWEETISRIARGWAKYSMEMPSSGWSKNIKHQVWVSHT